MQVIRPIHYGDIIQTEITFHLSPGSQMPIGVLNMAKINEEVDKCMFVP